METIEVEIKKKAPENFIEEFADRIVNGGGGFKCMEDREFCIFPDREVAVAEFVIRCLANPECEGSEDVLNAIINWRQLKSK